MYRYFYTFILIIISALSFSKVFSGPNTWTSCTNIPGQAIAVSQSNPQIIYLSGGDFLGDLTKLYRSSDGGNTWSFVTTFGVAIWSIAIDPYSSQTIYLGTQGLKVLRSDDGGNSFFSKTTGLVSTSCYPVYVDPISSNIVYCGNYFSKSTDYGQTWFLATTGINLGIGGLAIDYSNHLILYGVSYYNGAYKSINGGLNWSIISSGLPNTGGYDGVAIDIKNSQTVYLTGSGGSFFYKSTTGGVSWVGMNNGLTTPVNDILINPVNHNIIYLATANDGVYQSLDAGSTWAGFNGGTGLNGRSIYHLGMTLTAQTTLLTAGEGVWCYSYNPTSVSSTHWKALDNSPINESKDIKLKKRDIQ